MTIGRVKSGGWSVGKKVLSTELSQLDENISYALDKRAGHGTDSVNSSIELNGSLYVTEDGSFATQQEATVTIDLGATSNLQVFGGFIALDTDSELRMYSGSQAKFNDGSQLKLLSGSSMDVQDATIYGLTTGSFQGNASGAFISAVPGAFRLAGGNTDFPTFSAARSKKKTFGFKSSGIFKPDPGLDGWIVDAGFQAFSEAVGAEFVLAADIDMAMNGATLSTLELNYYSASHSPGTKAYFIMKRMEYATGTITNLAVSAAELDYGSSGNKTVTLALTQNNVIDTDAYKYFVFMREEEGSGALAASSIIRNFKCGFTNITQIRF